MGHWMAAYKHAKLRTKFTVSSWYWA